MTVAARVKYVLAVVPIILGMIIRGQVRRTGVSALWGAHERIDHRPCREHADDQREERGHYRRFIAEEGHGGPITQPAPHLKVLLCPGEWMGR